MRKRFVILLAMLFLAACAAPDSGVMATPMAEGSPVSPTLTVPPSATSVPTFTTTPSRTPRPSVTPTITPTATFTASPFLSPTSAGSLSEDGPWLVFLAGNPQFYNEHLYAINVDGTGLTRLSDSAVAIFSVQPAGPNYQRLIAYVSTADNDNWKDLRLHVISLPNKRELLNIALTSSQTDIDARSQAESLVGAPWDVAVAIRQWNSLAWSPDGNQLAFIGAMDGDSADVYTFSLITGILTWLTSGPSHANSPVWSPDGKYIANLGVNAFGTGAGADLGSVWATNADGSGSILLYDAHRSNWETFYGWMDASTLLVSDSQTARGDLNLRTIQVPDGTTTNLWLDCFTQASFESDDGIVLVALDDVVAEWCHADEQPGVYLFSPGSTQWQKVSDVAVGPAFNAVTWLPSLRFFVLKDQDGRWMTLDAAGNVAGPFGPSAFSVAISPDGQRWAWKDLDGSLWIGSPEEEPTLYPEYAVIDAIWTPDGQGLVIFSEDGRIILARAPHYESDVVATSLYLRPYRTAWLP